VLTVSCGAWFLFPPFLFQQVLVFQVFDECAAFFSADVLEFSEGFLVYGYADAVLHACKPHIMRILNILKILISAR
jgi:hypothetical protein